MKDQLDHILEDPKFLSDLHSAQPLKPTAHRDCQCGPLPLVFGFVLGVGILTIGIVLGATYL